SFVVKWSTTFGPNRLGSTSYTSSLLTPSSRHASGSWSTRRAYPEICLIRPWNAAGCVTVESPTTSSINLARL
ncbi:hypothetical protein BgiMline_007473, partial [Biomphalaria glabrata]